MTKTIKVPDLTYTINGGIVELQQDMGHGEFAAIDIHKIHLQLIAEEMGLYKPVHQAHMSEVVEAEIAELFWNLEDHWQAICKDKHMDFDHMVEAKSLYNKLYSICRLIGLDSDSLSNLESNKAEVTPTVSKSPLSPSEAPSKGASLNTLKPNQAALI